MPPPCSMKPRTRLAETVTVDGLRLALYEHDGHYQILLQGRELMHSFSTTSEYEMGVRVAAHLAGRPAPRYLIGGLGLGFTLRAVVEQLPPDGRIVVAELLPEIIAWNRTHLRGLNGDLLEHPQVDVYQGDVNTLLRNSEAACFDGILLDVDNGPVAMVQAGNAELYSPRGLDLLRNVLDPAGQVAFWSASADKAFHTRLRKAGYAVEAVPTKAYPRAKREHYVIYYARPVERR